MCEMARAVVDAGGRNDGLRWAELPGLPWNNPAQAARAGRAGLVACQTHYRRARHPETGRAGDPSAAGPGTANSGAVEIFLFPGGYAGICPLEDDLVNVCLLGRAADISRLGGAEAMLQWASATNSALGERLRSLTRCQDVIRTAAGLRFQAQPGAGQWLAVGDAAGMIAPICGDGISMALRSAELAAASLDAYFGGSMTWSESIGGYRSAWRHEFATRMRIGAALHRALAGGLSSALLLRAGRIAPRGVDWLIRRTRDSAGFPCGEAREA